MRSATPTLLDAYEMGQLPSIDDRDLTEWFDRAQMALPDTIDFIEVEDDSEPPLWTPEPVNRRWRARGWTHDD
jgi:hypothetical protein